MNIVEGYKYISTKSGVEKTSLMMIALKPIADVFYDQALSGVTVLQVYSGLLAVIMFVLIISSRGSSASTPWNIALLSVLLVVNGFVIVAGYPTFSNVSMVLKGLNIVVLYLFFRKLLVSDVQIVGWISVMGVYVAISVVLLTVTVIFFPINVAEARGQERVAGAFADAASAGMTVSVLAIMLFYHEIRHLELHGVRKFRIYQWAAAFVWMTTILFTANHAASTIIVSLVVLFGLLSLFSQRNIASAAFLIIVVLLVLTGSDRLIETGSEGMFSREFEVIEGSRGENQFLHGRWGRWETFNAHFWATDIQNQLFGIDVYQWPYMYLTVPHNDYYRMLYSAGLIGLFCYVVWLFQVGFGARRLPLKSSRYFVRATLIFIVLQSVTLTPSLYYVTMFMFIPATLMVLRARTNEVKRPNIT